MSAPIILLKEGTEQAQGKRQIISNIQACQVVADAVRTTLGPRGMDKLIVETGGKATISNDGATILKLLDIVFPAAKVLVDIAKSQDAEAVDFIKQISVNITSADGGIGRDRLVKCAATTLSSKLVSTQKDYFANMIVEAVAHLDEGLPINMIGIKKVHGGSLEDSELVLGVAFKKSFSYAGFEMQPKAYANPKIAMLNIELEVKAEKDNAEVRIDTVQEYQRIVDAEWNILYDKLIKIQESGATVVLSKLPIGDVATQWFADRDMFCAGRVAEEDMKRTVEACGGAIQTSVSNLTPNVLGTCEMFQEKQIGNERYNYFTGCSKAKTCSIILRGGAEQFIDETERSLHDAIMIVRRAMKNVSIVAGGGAIDMETSKYLRDVAREIPGKEQLLMCAFAKSFESIPRQLCYNAGFDATNLLNKLRQKHALGEKWFGIDMKNEDVTDTMESCVWEPSMVKVNAVTAAAEAACTVLSVDQTIKNPKSSNDVDGQGRGGFNPGRTFG
ncbi:unnamed protein product [Soboliphyme baturini]|uniref:T-complex protein 1 subunit eta n=1 Tax=Soboliphyme baturini TaxID=241478 RepID=A0A183II32_9BILA|nr:unnamed protein product [Soboliphyme baturini]